MSTPTNYYPWGFIYEVFCFLTPMYVANSFALLLGGGKPLDLGKKFMDGKRLLGDGKTFRGTIGGIFFGGAVGFLLCGLGGGLTLASGSILGDIFASFLKRRLKLERGEPAPLLDQLDFYLFASLFFSIVYDLKIEVFLAGLIVTPISHLIGNLLAYSLKIKDRPY